MNLTEESPTAPEIEAQLERMLASARFRNAKKQSGFLKLVVKRAVQGKKTSETVLGKKLLGSKYMKDESTHVRVAANKLRPALKRYYAHEGREDLVLITLPEPSKDKSIKLPEGEAYTPSFSYNATHPVAKEFKLGTYHLSRGMFEDYRQAMKHFVAVLRMAPEHIGAAIGLAEAYMSFLTWEREFDTREDIDVLADQAAGFLDRVEERASQFWRLHAAAGFMLTEHGRYLDTARVEFDKALKLDRAGTEDYPPYFYFLVQVGEHSEAQRLAKQHLEAHSDSMAAHIACAKVFIRTERFSDAQAVLEKALAMDKGNYAVHLYLALLYLAQRRPEEVLGHLLQVKLLADDYTYRMAFRWSMRIIEVWPQHLKEQIARLWETQTRSILTFPGASSK